MNSLHRTGKDHSENSEKVVLKKIMKFEVIIGLLRSGDFLTKVRLLFEKQKKGMFVTFVNFFIAFFTGILHCTRQRVENSRNCKEMTLLDSLN